MGSKGLPRAPQGSPCPRLPRWPTCIELSCLASFQNVTEKQKACETDLAKAEPALLAAQEALDTLNKVRERKKETGTSLRERNRQAVDSNGAQGSFPGVLTGASRSCSEG